MSIPTKLNGRPIAAGPSAEEYSAAVDVVNKMTLRTYQLLYAVGLTSPHGSPWKVKLDVVQGSSLSVWIRADGHGVSVGGRTPEEVFEKVTLVAEAFAAGKTKVSARACCPLATRRNCVCVESFACPVHGNQCHGSHD